MVNQSVNPSFNPDVEYMKDPLSRDIPQLHLQILKIRNVLTLQLKLQKSREQTLLSELTLILTGLELFLKTPWANM